MEDTQERKNLLHRKQPIRKITPDMQKSPTRTAVIALCLVSLVFVLASFSVGVLPLFSVLGRSSAASQSTAGTSFSVSSIQPAQTGTLVIKAAFFGVDGSGKPIADTPVRVTAAGSSSPAYAVNTNSSGEVVVSLVPGNYTIEFSAEGFNSTTGTQVYGNRVTEVVLVASEINNQSLLDYSLGQMAGYSWIQA